MGGEVLQLKQLEKISTVDELTEGLKNQPKEYKENVGKLIADAKVIPEKNKDNQGKNKEKLQSNELLKNFKYKDLIKNTVIKEALKFPEDPEQVKKIQGELGYKPGSKNYYPQEHQKDMKEADGVAGRYTMEALNNMIADGLTSDDAIQLSKDAEDNTDKQKSEQANKILDAYLKSRGY